MIIDKTAVNRQDDVRLLCHICLSNDKPTKPYDRLDLCEICYTNVMNYIKEEKEFEESNS